MIQMPQPENGLSAQETLDQTIQTIWLLLPDRRTNIRDSLCHLFTLPASCKLILMPQLENGLSGQETPDQMIQTIWLLLQDKGINIRDSLFLLFTLLASCKLTLIAQRENGLTALVIQTTLTNKLLSRGIRSNSRGSQFHQFIQDTTRTVKL